MENLKLINTDITTNKDNYIKNYLDYIDVSDNTQKEYAIGLKMFFEYCSLNNINNPYNKIKELIIPDSIIYVDDNIAGFAMPLVEKHKNFGTIINNPNVPLKTKLQYLYKLGNSF